MRLNNLEKREEGEIALKKDEKFDAGKAEKIGIVSRSESKLFFENKMSSSIKWLNTKETAEYLRTSPKQIRKWVYQGKMRAFKLCGRSLRFKMTDLDLLHKGGQSWG